jgi:hypothetical protein
MRLTIFSHKPCWRSAGSPTGYATDGGFPFQVQALSELFDETVVCVPVAASGNPAGECALRGHNLSIRPLTPLMGAGVARKLRIPFWTMRNAPAILHELARSGGVHAAIPGDVGTIGMAGAVLLGKPLYVRHCGNWLAPRTTAEHFWKWSMEHLAGGRRVMLATGGGSTEPSKNPEIGWIFSTSLSMDRLQTEPKQYVPGSPVRLVIACRQERAKGTGAVIESLPLLRNAYGNITLDVAGDGGALAEFRQLAESLGVAPYVRFHGKLPHSGVLDLFAGSTLFCYPTSASEGFPKAVLEALASGLPVLTTRVSVLPHLISQGCGELLSDRSPEAISDAVGRCLEPQRYAGMSRAAVQTARQYSLEQWRDSIGTRLEAAWGALREEAA